MFIQWPRLPFLPIEIFTIGSIRNIIVGPEKSTRPELRQEEFGNVLEGRGEKSVCLGPQSASGKMLNAAMEGQEDGSGERSIQMWEHCLRN